MDDLLQKAIERRDFLRRELAAVETFIHSYSTLLNAGSETPLFEQQELWFTPPSSRSRADRAEAVAAMMDDAEKFILDAGRPLTRGQLLAKLEEAGHLIEGGDKSKVLGTNLWRSRRFHNIRGVGYWPKKTPIPEQFRHFVIRDTMLS